MLSQPPDSVHPLSGVSARAVGLAIVDQLNRSPNVTALTSTWTAPRAVEHLTQTGEYRAVPRCGGGARDAIFAFGRAA
jgi:hypothetical protein